MKYTMSLKEMLPRIKSKNFDFGICKSYDVWMFHGMLNLGKSNLITMLQIEANRSKNVE